MAPQYVDSSTAVMEPLADLLPVGPPQFEGGGPTVCVRNTFLDIDERLPGELDLVRAQTAPPGGSRNGDRVEWSSSDEDEENAEGSPLPSQLPPPDENTEGALVRTVTRDWYEIREDWGGVHTSRSAPSSEWGMVPMVASPSIGTAAWPQGAVELPLWREPLPPPAKSSWVPGDHQAPVSSELYTVSAFAHAAPTRPPMAISPAVAAVPPAASTMAPAGASSIAPLSSAIPAAQPQTLTGAFCVNTGCFRALWWVDARKLRGNDKQAVSPHFEMSLGDSLPSAAFKMMIYPKIMNDQKGGASFKKAKGRGLVQIKCEAELSEAIATFSFQISIGVGENKQASRGPKIHNFSASAVCGLEKDEEEWDFQTVVDPESMTFVVCLEIEPLADARMRQT